MSLFNRKSSPSYLSQIPERPRLETFLLIGQVRPYHFRSPFGILHGDHGRTFCSVVKGLGAFSKLKV